MGEEVMKELFAVRDCYRLARTIESELMVQLMLFEGSTSHFLIISEGNCPILGRSLPVAAFLHHRDEIAQPLLESETEQLPTLAIS